MKILQRYLIKAFLGPFFLTFTLAMIILILQFVWLWIDELVGKGLEWHVIAELLGYSAMELVPMAMLLGVLLGSVMTFGKLGEHHELASIKASGISLFSSMKPLLFIITILALGSFSYSNFVTPLSNLKFDLLRHDIVKQSPQFMISVGEFNDGIEGYSIKVNDQSKDGKTFYGVVIYDHTKNIGHPAVTVADSCYMDFSSSGKQLILSLFSGSTHTEQLDDGAKLKKDTKPFRRDNFSVQEVLLDLPENSFKRSKEDSYSQSYRMLNSIQLADTARAIENENRWRKKQSAESLLRTSLFRYEDKSIIDSSKKTRISKPDQLSIDQTIKKLSLLDQIALHTAAMTQARQAKGALTSTIIETDSRGQWANTYWIAWHKKLIMALACIAFFLVGAPLGAMLKKGGLGLPVVISTFLFILWYIASIAGEKYARAGYVPLWAGAWASTFILLPVGMLITKRSSSESGFLSIKSLFRPKNFKQINKNK